MKSLKAIALTVLAVVGMSSGAVCDAAMVRIQNTHSSAVYFTLSQGLTQQGGYISANGERAFDVPAGGVGVYVYSTALDTDWDASATVGEVGTTFSLVEETAGVWSLQVFNDAFTHVAVAPSSAWDAMGWKFVMAAILVAGAIVSLRWGIKDGYAK